MLPLAESFERFCRPEVTVPDPFPAFPESGLLSLAPLFLPDGGLASVGVLMTSLTGTLMTSLTTTGALLNLNMLSEEE